MRKFKADFRCLQSFYRTCFIGDSPLTLSSKLFSSSFFFHLKEFSDTLNSLGVESKLVFDADYSDGFPSRKIRNWFQTKKKFNKLIDEFKPDAIFVDRQRHFGIDALKANIPLFVLLRGHYWPEFIWNKNNS